MNESSREVHVAPPDTRAGLVWRGIVGGVVSLYASLLALSGVLFGMITFIESVSTRYYYHGWYVHHFHRTAATAGLLIGGILLLPTGLAILRGWPSIRRRCIAAGLIHVTVALLFAATLAYLNWDNLRDDTFLYPLLFAGTACIPAIALALFATVIGFISSSLGASPSATYRVVPWPLAAGPVAVILGIAGFLIFLLASFAAWDDLVRMQAWKGEGSWMHEYRVWFRASVGAIVLYIGVIVSAVTLLCGWRHAIRFGGMVGIAGVALYVLTTLSVWPYLGRRSELVPVLWSLFWANAGGLLLLGGAVYFRFSTPSYLYADDAATEEEWHDQARMRLLDRLAPDDPATKARLREGWMDPRAPGFLTFDRQRAASLKYSDQAGRVLWNGVLFVLGWTFLLGSAVAVVEELSRGRSTHSIAIPTAFFVIGSLSWMAAAVLNWMGRYVALRVLFIGSALAIAGPIMLGISASDFLPMAGFCVLFIPGVLLAEIPRAYRALAPGYSPMLDGIKECAPSPPHLRLAGVLFAFAVPSILISVPTGFTLTWIGLVEFIQGSWGYRDAEALSAGLYFLVLAAGWIYTAVLGRGVMRHDRLAIRRLIWTTAIQSMISLFLLAWMVARVRPRHVAPNVIWVGLAILPTLFVLGGAGLVATSAPQAAEAEEPDDGS